MCNLDDGQVRLIRTLHSVSYMPPARIAGLFGLSQRHVKRIANGVMRKDAGGPICDNLGLCLERMAQELSTGSEIIQRQQPSPKEKTEIGYREQADWIRCARCRNKCKPSLADGTMCMVCAGKGN